MTTMNKIKVRRATISILGLIKIELKTKRSR